MSTLARRRTANQETPKTATSPLDTRAARVGSSARGNAIDCDPPFEIAEPTAAGGGGEDSGRGRGGELGALGRRSNCTRRRAGLPSSTVP